MKKESLMLLKIEIAAQILAMIASNPENDLSSPTWAKIACQNSEHILDYFLSKPASVKKVKKKAELKSVVDKPNE